ncbi:MAG: GIN domain-containing protein [Flavobacteriaceae bacterium]
MNKILITFIFYCLYVNGQKKSIGDFSELIIRDGLHVTLIKSETNEVMITSENEQGVTLTNKDGQLKISMKPVEALKGIDGNIELFYTGRINKIDVSRGAYLSIIDTIVTQNIDVISRKGGEIELLLDAKSAKYAAKTGGKIIVKGQVDQQHIHISSGGVVNAEHTLSKDTAAKILFGGSCDIQATSSFNLTTRFGGVARVHGNPLKTVHNKMIGGSIIFSKTTE